MMSQDFQPMSQNNRPALMEIPTLSNVMENLMGLQQQFRDAGIETSTSAAPAAAAPNRFAGLQLAQGHSILDQPERDEEEEEEEEELLTEEEQRILTLSKDLQGIREYMNWMQQAITADYGSRAAKIRKALRKALKTLRAKHHNEQEAREMALAARNKIREVEETFPDNIGIDTSDSDYDSQDSFFLDSDEEGDGDEFYF